MSSNLALIRTSSEAREISCNGSNDHANSHSQNSGCDVSGSGLKGRNGLPLCRYGMKCREIRNQRHTKRFDHEPKICKFGMSCRRMKDAEHMRCFSHMHAIGDIPKPTVLGEHLFDDEEVVAESAPEPAPPVPFVLLLLAVSAGALVVFPMIGDCKLQNHRFLLYSGFALTMPFCLFQAMLFIGRRWLLKQFFPGDYAEGAKTRELKCLWYPEKLQILEYTTGDLAGERIQTYATWETNDVATNYENFSGGNRDGGYVEKNPDGFSITIPESFGVGLPINVEANGELTGRLPFRASFDGSSIVAESGPREGQAWRKAGYWRMDFVLKVLTAMLFLGLEAMFVATLLPPGIGSASDARLPLKAVYLVDGSSSVTSSQWASAMHANKEFIANFEDVYGSNQGKLNFGLIQFSDEDWVELPVTNDLSQVSAKLDGMSQRGGMTRYDKALRLCQQQLTSYKVAGHSSFDVCVLITDGLDMSQMSTSELKGLVAKDTAIFGIFVGSDPKGKAELHNIVGCGKARKPGHHCDFFAQSQDYATLASRAREVAEDVTRGSDLALCAERSFIIETPVAMGLILPYILWYFSFCTITIAKRRLNEFHSNRQASEKLLMLQDHA